MTQLVSNNPIFAAAYHRPKAPSPIWAGGVQPQEESKINRVAAFGGALAGITALGFAPVGQKRVWDYYLSAIRAAEELSPAKFFRTFQYSEALSPFGSNKAFGFPSDLFTRQITNIAGETIAVPNRSMRRFMANMLGTTVGELESLGAFSKGLEFRRTGQMFGEIAVTGGPVLTSNALPLRTGTHAGASFMDWFARASGIDIPMTRSVVRLETPSMIAVTAPKIDKVLGIPIPEVAQLYLQKARVAGRMTRAYWAGQIGRLNRLLAAPADWFPSVRKLLDKAGVEFTVKPGTATQMLGRYAVKGAILSAAFQAFRYMGYRRKETEHKYALGALITGSAAIMGRMIGGARGGKIGAAIGATLGFAPVFDRGFLEGGATMVTRGTMGYAKASQALGLTESRQEQEALAPGITSLKTAIGFAGSGMMLGLLGGYGAKLASFIRKGIEPTSRLIEEELSAIRGAATGKGIKGWFGRQIGKSASGGIGQRLMLRGGRIGAMVGAGAYGLFALGAAWSTGNLLPGVLGAKRTPEELQRLYSGSETVPVRHGRWWEFGRCLTKSNTYELQDGSIKTSEEIEIGDCLIGRDFRVARVKQIFKRHHKGEVYRFFTAIDRDKGTEVTANHIVPIYRDGEIIEMPAENIKPNDWVEVPYREFEHTLYELDVMDFIKDPVYLEDSNVYCAQKNWYTKGLQRSGKSKISRKIDLDYDLGLLMGYFLAEGNIGFHGDRANLIETVHAKKEFKYTQDIERIVLEKFDTQVTRRFKTTGEKTKEGCWIVRICSGILAKLFRYLFYQQEYNAFDKRIPNIFYNANGYFLEGLIEGYWRGDGHMDGGTRIITSARKHLLESIQKISLSLGKPCGISVHYDSDFKSWRLRFVNENATNAPVMLKDGRLYARIRVIETDSYDDIVYDFEVTDKYHLFAAGTFLVHNSSWEGGRAYYRPHWYHMLMTGARTKGMYGTEEAKWEASPIIHPGKALFDEEFKYKWERENYYNRPYPVTGTYGSNVPFLAPITEKLGALIKPPKLMHTEEWARDGQVVHIPTSASHEPSYALGGKGPGAPVSKQDLDQQVGEFIYRINELRGLTGFLHGAVKEHLTGSQDYFDKLMQLEEASRATGMERRFWNLELGGGGGFTEPIRRFIPHRRRQIDLYNPIRNQMPTWLPGEDYYIDFRHGDPFMKVPEGEIRLPGPGYSALNPEVAGLSADQYPLFHQFKILSDVAMYSDEFKTVKRQMRSAIKRGDISDEQAKQFNLINQQVSERKKRKRFMEYRLADDALEQKRVIVTEVLPSGFIQTKSDGVIGPGGIEIRGDKGSETYRRKQLQMADYIREHVGPGAELDIFVHRDPLHRFKKADAGYYQPAILNLNGENLNEKLVDSDIAQYVEQDDPFAIRTKYNAAQRMFGALWEKVAHYESPREYLLPFSPKAKFIHQRSAIEEYERSRVWGTESAFWQHPVKHFLKPTKQMTERMLGSTEIPEDVQRRRQIEEYFDTLKWVKYKSLERAAAQSGDQAAAKEFQAQQRRTLFGVNPFGSLSYVYSALPSLDRDYYEAFKDAKSQEDRRKIMEILPENQKHIYLAQWTNQLASTLRAKISMGLADDSAKATLAMLNTTRATEGRDINPELYKEYQQEREKGESYADWSRRQAAADYFEKAPLPNEFWVGWNPTVDLEDVKLKLIKNLGEDMHDYNLWQSREKELVRKPYITDQPLAAQTKHPAEISKAIEVTLRSILSLQNVQVHVLPGSGGQDELDLEISDDRKSAIQKYKQDPNFMEMV